MNPSNAPTPRTPPLHSLKNRLKVLEWSVGNWIKIRQWERAGSPANPPHAVKQRAIREAADNGRIRLLVETGTHYGAMIAAMILDFDKIYSIELSPDFHARAQERFRKDGNVELLLGDSGDVLAELIKEIDQPCVFWLDGHYSGGITARGVKDTPIFEELNHIFEAEDHGHAIVIDDARCFGEDPTYPTIEELRQFVKSKRPSLHFEVRDDIIRIMPAGRC